MMNQNNGFPCPPPCPAECGNMPPVSTRPQRPGGVQFQTPPQQDFDTPEMMGSMQMILASNIGEYVVVEFLIGTERLMRKQGLLYHVGTSYITLYDDRNNLFIVCDIFSIKFVYFFFPGQRPDRNYNALPRNDSN